MSPNIKSPGFLMVVVAILLLAMLAVIKADVD